MRGVARRLMAEAYAGITPAEALLEDRVRRRLPPRRKLLAKEARSSRRQP